MIVIDLRGYGKDLTVKHLEDMYRAVTATSIRPVYQYPDEIRVTKWQKANVLNTELLGSLYKGTQVITFEDVDD